MKLTFSKESISVRSAVILSILSIAFALIASWVGPEDLVVSLLPMAVSTGFLASLIHFECEKFKPLRFIAPIFVLIIDWILNGFYSLGGIIIVVSALMIFLTYEQQWSKVESALTMSMVVAGLITLMFVVIGVQSSDGISVKEFYTELFEQFKSEYVIYFEQAYSAMYEGMDVEPISSEYIIQMLDFIFGLIVAILFVSAFIFIGIATKIFAIVLNKCDSDKEKLNSWRFTPNPVYAYFYMVVELLTMFISSELTTFNLCISNLSLIFMPLFWYMGIKAAGKLINERKKLAMPTTFTVLCVVAIAVLFPRILSYIGVFYCIISSKINLFQRKGD